MGTQEVRERFKDKLLETLPPALAPQTDDNVFAMFDADGDDE